MKKKRFNIASFPIAVLPRYVSRLAGFSPYHGRMFFRGSASDNGGLGDAIFSSRDGVRLELTEALPTDFRLPQVVSGVSRTEVGDVLWNGMLPYKGELLILHTQSALARDILNNHAAHSLFS